MTHVTLPKIRVARPRTRGEILAQPQAQARLARDESIAAPLTLAAIVVTTPLVAATIAIASAVGG